MEDHLQAVWVAVLIALMGQGWKVEIGTLGIRITGTANEFQLTTPRPPMTADELRGVIVTLELGGFRWAWEEHPLS